MKFKLIKIILIFLLSFGFNAFSQNKVLNFDTKASFYNNRGVEFFEKKEYEKAIESFKTAIDLNKNFEKAHFNLATVLWQLNQTSETISALQKAVEINPKYVQAQAKLCDVFLALEQNENAGACYEKLLSFAPKDVQTNSNYGVVLMHLKRFEEAAKIFEENNKNFTPNAENLNNLGIVLLELNRYKKAVEVLRRAVNIEPNNEMMRYNLAIAQLAFKDKNSALEQYAFLKKTNENLAEKLFQTIFRGNILNTKQQ
ncbi:MAG TPA: tetratricopeptide repeat protein [Pyrinomonadaceae bacterium]|nr:tetratricopeptide repeat protein [Pyrinomonadaceae bacterium]